MPAMIRLWFSLAILLFAVPSHAQDEADSRFPAETISALKGLQLLDQRMNAIGYRLVDANASYCQTKVARAGILLHDANQYGDQAAARFALGFDGPIAINAVAPGSPAAKAELAPGDGLFVINNVSIADISLADPKFAQEVVAYRRIAAVNQTLEEALAKGATSLRIRVGGISRTVIIDPVQTCPGRFQIEVSDDRNASANGKTVSVSSRLAEYFLSDDEFAAVVAHELAHNLLKHRERLNAQKVNRGFFGQFGKSARRIKQTEIEADRLSVWLMANAGYDPRAAIGFWTRYGKQFGKGIFSASTHYRWKKRVGLLEEEIAKMEAIQPGDGKMFPPLLMKREGR